MTARADIDACAIALQSEGNPQSGRTWVHLLPAGTFSGRDGRGPYSATDADAIMQASRQIAGRSKMPIDYNHAIDFAAPKGGGSPAAGWIVGLQSRSDGIWGAVEWTPRAAQHIADREYRYISPAFAHAPDGQVKAILRASLVNYPNLTQLVALASAETTMADRIDDAQNLQTTMSAIRALLGLPDDADAAAITGAIGQLKAGTVATQSPDPAKFVPIGDFLRVTQELHRVHQGVEAHAAKAHVEEQVRAGRLLPFLKDWGIALCTANKPAFDDFVSKSGGNLQRMLGPSGASSKPPPERGGRESDLSDTDAHVARVLGHTSEQFHKAGQD